MDTNTVLIVDIEATCWENHKNPPDEHSEIIEIGICAYDMASATIIQKEGILVQPIESQVSPFCTELTSITPEMLAKDGSNFEQAIQKLQSDYQSGNRLWMSWGNYDRRMFIEQCQRRDIEYPFRDQHCNLKSLFANIYGNRLGMKAALNKINLDLQGTHHRGVDDAVNITRILNFMLKTYGNDLLESFWE